MSKPWSKLLFYAGSFLACGMMALSTGCASGGYKITRGYASWVNSKSIIIRIILYIFTSFVFAITLLIDAVVFNTMDFWNGTISGGKFEFKDGEKTYQVKHEVLPGSLLKRSTIQVLGSDHMKLQTIVLNETSSGEIELSIDGKLRSRVRNINSIPVASIYDLQGQLVTENFLFLDMKTLNFHNVVKR